MEQKEQHIVWHDDVVMKQFISYAVGCMMRRYRLEEGSFPVHRHLRPARRAHPRCSSRRDNNPPARRAS